MWLSEYHIGWKSYRTVGCHRQSRFSQRSNRQILYHQQEFGYTTSLQEIQPWVGVSYSDLVVKIHILKAALPYELSAKTDKRKIIFFIPHFMDYNETEKAREEEVKSILLKHNCYNVGSGSLRE